MDDELKQRHLAAYKAINKHFAELPWHLADSKEDIKTWATTVASGSAAHVFAYLQVDCNLKFSDRLRLTFNGNSLVIGLGATGPLGGIATFLVDPRTLINANGITFKVFARVAGGGGFQLTWYRDEHYIGHGEFYGVGVTLDTPGSGWGNFKQVYSSSVPTVTV